MKKKAFITKMMQLGVELDKVSAPIDCSMIINDAEILYDEHMKAAAGLTKEKLRELTEPERDFLG